MSFTKPTLKLLGNPEIHLSASVCQKRLQNKVLALLSYLALESGRHARDALGLLLWPDLSAQAARANLRKTIFKLHQVFGENIPQADADTLFIPGDALTLDVAEFLDRADEKNPDRLEYKASLYRGPLLDLISNNPQPT